MKAAVLYELNGPDGLRYEEVPDPEPGPGEILVRLGNAALNRRDIFVTHGMYPGAKPDALPVVLGSDGSGEVVALGEDADGPAEESGVIIHPSLHWGDNPRTPGRDYRILGLPDDGTYAQLIKIPAENVFEKPAHLSTEEAAAIPLAGLTAYRALFTRGLLKSGETVVVPGIGGGVATFLVQMAKAAGAVVFVTSGSEENIEKAKELGAEGGVNYNSGDWVKELRSMTGGVDLSVDSVGGEVFDALVTIAKPGSRIVTFGATAGPVPRLVMPKIFLKHLDIYGTAMGNADEFGAMLNFYAEHDLHPVINKRFPLEETALAHKYMESGKGSGKIILDIPS